MEVRVRIAPSPTGALHVGGVHIALYNYLFAKKHKGKFLLRIEDTDKKRSKEEFIFSIIEGLKWLGLDYDEKICKQSERFSIYLKYANKLLEEGKAYYCYCTKQELLSQKEEAIKNKKPWKYNRRCYKLTKKDKEKLKNRKKAIRFLIPDGEVSFTDLLHGKLTKHNKELEDFVIIKSDLSPSYNFACAIDDYEFKITHIIRGEDHITNTFKQILIYKTMNWSLPKFVHLPMILGEDRSKLSKRHGALSLLEYKQEGFLKETMINFLALLGWTPIEGREFYSLEELIELFSLEKLSKRPSIFDVKKLEWMNGEYINRLSDEEILKRICEIMKIDTKKEYLLKVIHLLKPRMKKLTQIEELGDYFFHPPKEYDKNGIEKHFSEKQTLNWLEKVNEELAKLQTFTSIQIESTVRKVAEKLEIKAAKIIHPIRIAITGKTVGPSLFHLMEVVGKEEVVKRINKIIKELK